MVISCQRCACQERVHAGHDDPCVAPLHQAPPRLKQRRRAADPALLDNPRMWMQPKPKFLLDGLQKHMGDAFEPPWPFWFGNTYQHGNPLRLLTLRRHETLANRARRHIRELRYAAPRFLQFDRAAYQPFAVVADEARLLEIVDATTYCCTTLFRGQPDARYETDAEHRERRHRTHASSRSAALSRTIVSIDL